MHNGAQTATPLPMLFNSYFFIFAFLPVTLLGYRWLCARRWYESALGWLVLCSFFFYGWWNPAYLGLIVGSIAFNYALGAQLGRNSSRLLLTLGVLANLGLLGYYKYANFFVDSINWAIGSSYHLEKIILPLAISFFTFQQISYLVDTFRGETREYNFTHYCLFVTFFPQLIAGPIVHHKEMLPQFMAKPVATGHDFAVGLTIFFVGLFKKTVLADGIAVYSSPMFQGAGAGVPITLLEAWGGALAYTLQLYFDFSGYSDMAVGLARLFGIRLPVNFFSPFKSRNMSEMWTRWHVTLSRFLRDYLYIALGGNRKGAVRKHANQFATMVLGGLWHGAGWTFVVWGTLHGVFLLLHHYWRSTLLPRIPRALQLPAPLATVLAVGLTFVCWTVAAMVFRAESQSSAWVILQGMLGMNGVLLTPGSDGLGHVLQQLGLAVEYTPQAIRYVTPLTLLWVIGLLAICFGLPNIYEILRDEDPVMINPKQLNASRPRFTWRPTVGQALWYGLIGMIALLHLNQVSEFLYFQF